MLANFSNNIFQRENDGYQHLIQSPCPLATQQ
jgi:hypothetical protein